MYKEEIVFNPRTFYLSLNVVVRLLLTMTFLHTGLPRLTPLLPRPLTRPIPALQNP